ncbi:MAG: ribosome small subunit-dependent GTPase A [Ruminococcaceae bacterium]|jgi:ribosome biogenesis GTPase|nr:ribosome small subunit-dependent GTPase A [Oscillospiraceae bacterium]
MSEGLIVKINSGIYTVKTEGGTTECSLRGKFRIEKNVPVVGDVCEFSSGVIEKIAPRKNYMIRPKLANVDVLLVVFSVSDPAPQLEIIDKITVMAEKNGIIPLIVITKTDLADCDDTDRYKNIYLSAGYKVIVTSAEKEDDIENLLKDELRGKIAAVAGCSGVGKSTLLNRIFGGNELRTGEISAKNKRGRHTTTHIQLFEKFGGYIADTPGFTSFEIIDAKKEELEQFFPEIRKNLGGCRFAGCTHINEPDCAVKDALEAGDISVCRYENYVKFYNDIKSRQTY